MTNEFASISTAFEHPLLCFVHYVLQSVASLVDLRIPLNIVAPAKTSNIVVPVMAFSSIRNLMWYISFCIELASLYFELFLFDIMLPQ